MQNDPNDSSDSNTATIIGIIAILVFVKYSILFGLIVVLLKYLGIDIVKL